MAGGAQSRPKARDLYPDSWQRFAVEDPYTYILTSLGKQDRRAFWESGESTVTTELLPLIRSSGVRTGYAMELGCGLGRLAFPLSRHFHEIVGADIAEEMVRRANSFAEYNNIHNARFNCIAGPENVLCKLGGYAGRIDFLYSLLVLQHIADYSVIEGYLHVIHSLLAAEGLAYLQFDTRPQHAAYRLKTSLPDVLLPRFWRRGIRRIRRSPAEIAGSLRRAGLQIVKELSPGTAYHRYLLKRAPDAQSSR